MPHLERLSADHGPAVLAFERENRAYFAAFISDRGDEFFDEFAERYAALLIEQGSGHGLFYALLDDDGSVLGRFNLYAVEDGTARLGYRVAERVAGHGVATATVEELCTVAASLGLRTLTAATSAANVASSRVLVKAGFVPIGQADPTDIGNKKGTLYRRDLP